MMSHTFKHWLLLVMATTVFCGLVAVTEQQQLRQAANDPQIQLAEDLANKLASGRAATDLVGTDVVDLAKSLAPYVMVFDKTGQVVATTAQLNGKTPTLPTGVLQNVRIHAQNRITWQPQPGVREAIVVVHYQNDQTEGFVVAGRSLREVERRVDQIYFFAGSVWLITIGASFLAIFLFDSKKNK